MMKIFKSIFLLLFISVVGCSNADDQIQSDHSSKIESEFIDLGCNNEQADSSQVLKKVGAVNSSATTTDQSIILKTALYLMCNTEYDQHIETANDTLVVTLDPVKSDTQTTCVCLENIQINIDRQSLNDSYNWIRIEENTIEISN